MINSLNISMYMLIVYVLVIAGPQPINQSLMDLTTITPTGGGYSQTPTVTSSTPAQTYTPSVTPSITPTTTLMPLPAITLIFPAPTITSIVTETHKSALGTQTPSHSDGSKLESVSPRMRVLSIILVIIWIILACFLVLYIRQLR